MIRFLRKRKKIVTLFNTAMKLNDESYINEVGKNERSFIRTLNYTYIKKYSIKSLRFHRNLKFLGSVVEDIGELPVLGSLSIKDYLNLQDILHKKTGRYWPMNEFITYFTRWLIYNETIIKNDTQIPLFNTNYNRYYNLGLFCEKFKNELIKERKRKGTEEQKGENSSVPIGKTPAQRGN